jgi:hypothetical protein
MTQSTLRWVRRAVFGEPLRAHPAKIGWIDAPGNACVVKRQRANGCDENCDSEQHGLDAAGHSPAIAVIVPDRAAIVCAVMHICTRSEVPDTVQYGTAAPAARGYTHLMYSRNMKTVLFVDWVIAVCLTALAIGTTSVPNWVVVAFVAGVPPLVVRSFWHAPEQTISASIHEARRERDWQSP